MAYLSAQTPPMAPILCQLKFNISTRRFMASQSDSTTSPTSSPSFSPVPTLFQVRWPPCVPSTHQVQLHLRTLAITIPSAWNTLPPDHPMTHSPNSAGLCSHAPSSERPSPPLCLKSRHHPSPTAATSPLALLYFPFNPYHPQT